MKLRKTELFCPACRRKTEHELAPHAGTAKCTVCHEVTETSRSMR